VLTVSVNRPQVEEETGYETIGSFQAQGSMANNEHLHRLQSRFHIINDSQQIGREREPGYHQRDTGCNLWAIVGMQI